VFCTVSKIEGVVLKLRLSVVMSRSEGAAMSHEVGKERALERTSHITTHLEMYP
jgi:hypothetical protein